MSDVIKKLPEGMSERTYQQHLLVQHQIEREPVTASDHFFHQIMKSFDEMIPALVRLPNERSRDVRETMMQRVVHGGMVAKQCSMYWVALSVTLAFVDDDAPMCMSSFDQAMENVETMVATEAPGGEWVLDIFRRTWGTLGKDAPSVTLH